MRPNRFFLSTFKGNYETGMRGGRLGIPLHCFQHPYQRIHVIVKVGEQLDGQGGHYCTVGRCADIALLLQHVQGVADAVRGLVQQLGEFHDADRLVVCYSPCHFEMAAHQLDLVLHLFKHGCSLFRFPLVLHIFWGILFYSIFLWGIRLLVKP
jgi:hypothetical protein